MVLKGDHIIIRVIFTAILLVCLTVGVNGQLPGGLPEKKVLRSLEKQWGDRSFDLQLIDRDDAGNYFNVTADGSPVGYFYSGRVNTCRPGGCAIPGQVADISEGFENFLYYVVVDSRLTVKDVKIFEYNATHGQEVSARSWLKQFLGLNPMDDPGYGDEISAISGATISGLSITADINRMLDRLAELSQGQASSELNREQIK